MVNLKHQTKYCKACGLEFHNRKKWASRGVWQEIVYCSDRCRKQYKNEKQKGV